MKTFFKLVLWALALVVLALVCWGVALYADWPLWAVPALFIGAIGLCFVALFARRTVILMRSRSKLAQQSAALRADVPDTASPQTLLVRKWKTAVATLRRSNLRGQGNPLYALPWYMVIGQSGTGKTTALTRARLSSPIQKVSQHTEIGQTVNCDWWYFDRAVVIDCAGRYVDVQDAEQDRREWELGLDLLGRYRAREGLDGLVLAVSADRLATPDADAIADEGRVVRMRIDQLIRMFGKRFPIYVLITKCDRLYGFEEWAKMLPADTLDQAMGYLADERDDGVAGFAARAFDSIGERLRALRVVLVARDPQPAPELLMFPLELDRLRAGFTTFVAACMSDSAYLEQPLLRGLFFSSGLQQGGAASLAAAPLPVSPAHPAFVAGLFLHDFFGRILPRDRDAARPAALRNPWRRVTRNVGVAAWLCMAIALGILLSISFAGNLQTLQLVRGELPDGAAMSGSLAPDAAKLMRDGDLLMRVEHTDRRWLSGLLAGRAGLSGLEARLRARFVDAYRHAIVPAVDQDVQADLSRANAGGSADTDAARARLILDLARSIALTQARINGADRAALDAMPQPWATPYYAPALDQKLQQLAVSHLAWSSPLDPYLHTRIGTEREWLDQLVQADPQLTWLVRLVGDDGTPPPVRASDFWGRAATAATVTTIPDGTRASDGDVIVPARYTAAGKAQIDRFAAEIRASVGDPVQFDSRRAAFDDWYRERRIAAWQRFADAFVTVPKPFATEADWRASLGTVGSSQSPYFRVIARLADEFGATAGTADPPLPGWLRLAVQFRKLREQATGFGAANQAVKWVGAINAAGGAAIRETLAGSPQRADRAITDNLGAVDALTLYLGELNQLAADSGAGAAKDYQLAADFHQTAAGAPPSAVRQALAPLARLQNLIGGSDGTERLTWRLVRGPLDFILAYVERQTSCELQRNWQSSVLWPLQGATDRSAMVDQLFGAKGTVWAFADGPAKPFLVRDASRYTVIDTQGYSVPLSSAFLPMLNGALGRQLAQRSAEQRGIADKQAQQLRAQQAKLEAQQTLDQLDRELADAKQQADAARAAAVALTITAQPMGVNDDAKAKPFASVLSIQCAAGMQTLNNYNFPVSASFAWTPGQCGDTSLQVRIGKLTLVRRYAGPLGVAAFLRDFRSGRHRFEPADFPGSEAALGALGVTQITLGYAFVGSDGVLDAARAIERYDGLQKSTAAQRQQIQDAQAARQQLDLGNQIAQLNPPLPTLPSLSSLPPLPALPVDAPTPADLGLPAVIGECWPGGAPAVTASRGGV